MNLQPVDFKAVATKGCFVYCYLRSKDSKTAKAGTPYYVGIAKNACRPTSAHKCPVPLDLSLIRLMRAELSWEEACRWESYYIAKYGRKDLGAGVLLNLTDGGDGLVNPSKETRRLIGRNSGAARVGIVFSESHRTNISASLKGVPKSSEHAKKAGLARRGKRNSEASIEKMRQTKTGQKQSPAHVEARRKGLIGHVVTAETRAKLSAAHKGRTFTDETKRRMSESGKKRKPASAETREKISAATRGRKKTPQQVKAASEARKAAEAARRLSQGITPEMYEQQKREAARERARRWWNKKKAALESVKAA